MRLHPIATRDDRDDRGVVALELVLILPVLLMLLVGSLVLGNYLSVKGQASNWAREGARQAALFPGQGFQDIPDDVTLTIVSTACPPSPRNPTMSVTVRATMPVALTSIPLIGQVVATARSPKR